MATTPTTTNRGGHPVQERCKKGGHPYDTMGRVRLDGAHECLECKRQNGRRHERMKKHVRRMERLLRDGACLTALGLTAWQRTVLGFFEDVEAGR